MNLMKTQCLASLSELDELDIKTDPEYRDCVINLDEVESFMADEDHEGTEITAIVFRSGESFSIRVSFEDFLIELRKLFNVRIV